jgi:hypothetical protein
MPLRPHGPLHLSNCCVGMHPMEAGAAGHTAGREAGCIKNTATRAGIPNCRTSPSPPPAHHQTDFSAITSKNFGKPGLFCSSTTRVVVGRLVILSPYLADILFILDRWPIRLLQLPQRFSEDGKPLFVFGILRVFF